MLTILCDFDDTVAAANVGQSIFKRFQPDVMLPGVVPWEEIRNRYSDREISLAKYQELAFLQLDQSKTIIENFVRESRPLRSGFKELVEFCNNNDIAIAITSHGLDFYITAALDSEDINIPIHSVETYFEKSEMTFKYPYADKSCFAWPGNCKCKMLEQYQGSGDTIIYAGDSTSDACPALRADYVFARDWLVTFCTDNAINYQKLGSFYDIIDYAKKTIGDYK